MKKCSKCELEKPLGDFSINKSKPDGHSSICKKCHSIYRKEHYLKNKEKVMLQVYEYKLKNPDKYIKKKVNRFHKKEGRTIEHKCCECGDLVYAKRKEIEKNKNLYCSIECRNKKNKSNYYVYLKDVKRRAIKLNKEFTINEEFVKNLLEKTQGGKCKITNIPIKVKDRNTLSDIITSASLDRIDNSKGYTEDNVQWVCLGINYMKSKSTDEKVHELIKLIIKNY